MTSILTDLSPEKLVEAIEASYAEYTLMFARSPFGEIYHGPDLMRCVSGIPVPMRNGVFQARLASDQVDTRIGEMLAYFEAHHLPMMWVVGPASQPPDLGTRLMSCGFIHAFAAAGMAADLQAINEQVDTPPEFVIRPVTDRETLWDFVSVFNTSFGLPETVHQRFFDGYMAVGLGKDQPLRHYVGYLDKKPVATASVVLGESVAGVNAIGTIPEVRRKGIGAAITLVTLREARAAGYRVAVLASSPIAQGVYRQLGFKEYCTLDIFMAGEGVEIFAH